MRAILAYLILVQLSSVFTLGRSKSEKQRVFDFIWTATNTTQNTLQQTYIIKEKSKSLISTSELLLDFVTKYVKCDENTTTTLDQLQLIDDIETLATLNVNDMNDFISVIDDYVISIVEYAKFLEDLSQSQSDNASTWELLTLTYILNYSLLNSCLSLYNLRECKMSFRKSLYDHGNLTESLANAKKCYRDRGKYAIADEVLQLIKKIDFNLP